MRKQKQPKHPGEETPEELRDEAIRERDAASQSALALLQALEKLFHLTRKHISGGIEREINAVIQKARRGR